MYSKEQQLKWNKSNRKPKTKKSKASNDEIAFLNWAKDKKFGCFVCGGRNTELHHIKLKSTDKKNHYHVIPLCIEHHKGYELSPHGTPTKWREIYTMSQQIEFAECMYGKYKEEEWN